MGERMQVCVDGRRLSVGVRGRTVLAHAPDAPWLAVGRGEASYQMHKGNFRVEDHLVERIPLVHMTVRRPVAEHEARVPGGVSQDEVDGASGHSGVPADVAAVELLARGRGDVAVRVFLREEPSGDLVITLRPVGGAPEGLWNRWWMRVPARPEEAVFGCGEQFSCLNLRGRRFPIWVSEQGVGRNKRTYETFLADASDGAGGDYYTTYFPQPTFVSSDGYYVHVETSGYSVFDFRAPEVHQVEVWGAAPAMRVGVAENLPAVLERLTAYLGRQPALPDWAYDGVWLGLQGGTEVVRAKLRRALAAGVPVAAVWAQDWEGRRVTPFGRQLMWNWQWDADLYPGLDRALQDWRSEGVRLLGYVNGFLATDGALYAEARDRGYLVRDRSGDPYLVTVTSFPAGLVDLTHPDARAWLKRVIQTELLDFGSCGWMADFGEYLPTDAVLYDGCAEEMHNRWPVLWAQLNHEVLEASGRLGDAVFFTRAGYAHAGRYTPLVWAGDQNVDWSRDDGLPSVVPAALSLGMSGVGLHHSDIGGYTTLFHMKRTKELFQRWTELAAFTLVMRTHEGNRPDDNWQFDGDDETLQHFARMAQVHVALKPYLKAQVHAYRTCGLPVMRPICLYDDDPVWHNVQDAYLLGPDVLVAPVLEAGVCERTLTLPKGRWVHLWSGRAYGAGEVRVPAPIGEPPVFFRDGSAWGSLFESIRRLAVPDG
ncbi:MAG: alpha-glucosidase [Alicyclobacillus sp.]|nr:alpha-glucosidase [Alicyclobacillus sp.]